MKKVVCILLVIVLLLGSSITAKAEEITFNYPQHSIYNYNIENHDYMATLRMSFPDKFFEENLKIVNDILTGKRKELIDVDNKKEMSYLFKAGLYLLPYQMLVYNYETYKLGLSNSYFNEIYKAQDLDNNSVRAFMEIAWDNYLTLGFFSYLDL